MEKRYIDVYFFFWWAYQTRNQMMLFQTSKGLSGTNSPHASLNPSIFYLCCITVTLNRQFFFSELPLLWARCSNPHMWERERERKKENKEREKVA